jgi:glutamine amidotransferase-like uncharacterized protein
MKLRVLLLLLISSPVVLADDAPVRVAIFQGAGVGPSSEQLVAALQAPRNCSSRVFRITPEEILAGGLSEVDVLVHPGGSGSGQGKALGEPGRVAIREFVNNGGGYLGVCAGAYLATNDYTWSLGLIDAKVLDRRHWARGKGTVTLQLSPKASEFFGQSGSEMTIHYAQGPLLARREWDDPEVPDYESLAIFATEIAENGAPRGVMVGTSAVVRCQYGRGRVFCFSPHPELTDGLSHLIPLAVTWLATGNGSPQLAQDESQGSEDQPAKQAAGG